MNEEQDIIESLYKQEFYGSDDFHLFQTWYRLKRPVEGNYYSYLASRTIFNPYQFKPLSKFIAPGSEERLFIADEVGVGKTIETGIIITELIARNRMDRKSPILVVCPNSLGPKWVKEMKDRFHLNFHLHDGSSLKNALSGVSAGGYLPDGAVWSVVNLTLLRYKDNLELLKKINAQRQSPLWSMVIVDEAHHMRNKATESNELGNILSSMTETMLMLSATPLNLRNEDLFNQLHILNPSLFPDSQTFGVMLEPVQAINRCRRLLSENSVSVFSRILSELNVLASGTLGKAISEHPDITSLRQKIMRGIRLSPEEIAKYDKTLISLSPLDNSFTRTLKREAMERIVIREVRKLPVSLSPQEKAFHDEVIELVKDTFIAGGDDPTIAGFISNMPRRMVSSCIPAMKEYLEWMLENNKILIDEAGSREEVGDDFELGSVELPVQLRGKFKRLRDQAVSLSRTDTKFEVFLNELRQLRKELKNPQIIVFSFFIRTLKYLQKRLAAEGFRVGLISGEIPVVSDGKQPGRYDIMENFEKGDLDILLSSEVGGEGLDFQYCQSIINYDLPYNPMRIEQRIGRIDRFGQNAEKIFVTSMYLKDTVDENIYFALYDRIRLVEESIGGLEPIIGNQLIDLQKDIITGQLTKEQLDRRVDDLAKSLEKAKLEREQFEQNRRALMGDDYFTNPLHNLENQTEFVKPSDAALLTKMYLSSLDKCDYKEIDPERGQLRLSKEFLSRLEQFTRQPGSEGSRSELSPLLERRFPLNVIFNGSLANEYKNHVFLSPCGFWVRFLLSELESAKKIRKVFCFHSTAVSLNLDSGTYIVPIFEIKLDGFRVELDIAAVPILQQNKRVADCDFRRFSRQMYAGIRDCTKETLFIDDDPESLIDLGSQAVEQQMEEKLESLKAENNYRITARISSLERGSQIRIQRYRQKIADHIQRRQNENKEPSEEFIKLTESTIENDRRRTQDKVDRLRSKSELSLTVSLIGIAVMFID
ncbi:MAG: DEAD/DEAH box helicase [Desulfococcaceae bacterium]